MCSGAIFKKMFPSAILIGWDYGQPIPYDKIRGNTPVYMVDCSASMNEMAALGVYSGNQFTWIDHHLSAIMDFLDYEAGNLSKAAYIHPYFGNSLNQKIAACELTWQYLCKDIPSPVAIDLLGTFDTFRNGQQNYWKQIVLPFQYGMQTIGITNADNFPQELLTCEDKVDDQIMKIVSDGKIALRYATQKDTVSMQGSHVVDFEGYKALACNGPGLYSMAFDSVYDTDKHDIMMPYKFDGDQWCFSLYSDKDIDVGQLAKKYGGGGHKSAAGFKTSTLPDFITNK